MWQHQTGRIDFDEPLFELAQRGWRFREHAPTLDDRDGGCWAVVGVHGGARVRVDRSERREAWAELVRLALIPAIEHDPLLAVRVSRTMGDPPDDPTARDEEHTRLKTMGWSFSEHLTAQASGQEGWVVSGTSGARRIQVVDDDREDAWSTALILAAASGTAWKATVDRL